ncbi:TPA: hypothetical protein DHW51_21475 [Candidatus Poribacteria bacterium]|nr:hypothetical protein [Candidatus Poribacteria bacterium]
MIPRVNTPKQVEEIVSWLRYPPDGIRGYAQTSLPNKLQVATSRRFHSSNREGNATPNSNRT